MPLDAGAQRGILPASQPRALERDLEIGEWDVRAIRSGDSRWNPGGRHRRTRAARGSAGAFATAASPAMGEVSGRRGSRAGRQRMRRGTGLRGHPHPLRCPGDVGPHAHHLALARSHHGGRVGNCGFGIAPTRPEHREPDPAHLGEGGGHVATRLCSKPASAKSGASRASPSIWTQSRERGVAINFRRHDRPHPPAPLRDGRGVDRARGHRERRSTRCSS